MSKQTIVRSATGLMVAIALAGVTASCNDDGPEDEPDVQTVRLVIGTGASALTVDIDRADPRVDITIPLGAHAVTATFLDGDGVVEPLVNATEFELRLEGMSASIATFTRTGAFTGTLTGVAAGDTDIIVQLYHLEEMHEDFEKSGTLTVTS